jgi:hypothetical protein
MGTGGTVFIDQRRNNGVPDTRRSHPSAWVDSGRNPSLGKHDPTNQMPANATIQSRGAKSNPRPEFGFEAGKSRRQLHTRQQRSKFSRMKCK